MYLSQGQHSSGQAMALKVYLNVHMYVCVQWMDECFLFARIYVIIYFIIVIKVSKCSLVTNLTCCEGWQKNCQIDQFIYKKKKKRRLLTSVMNLSYLLYSFQCISRALIRYLLKVKWCIPFLW